MDASDLLAHLWLATWTSSAAIVVVLSLRGVLRHRFGVGIAYAAWAAVPVALLALALPAPTRTLTLPDMMAVPVAPGMPSATVDIATNGFDATPVLIAGWLIGVIASLLLQWWQQARFQRGLGRLECVDATARIWRAQCSAGLPALVGLWRPLIVLPADIDERFDARQRALMILHERTHLRHGDAWINAGAALLRALFWFNPLVHVAGTRLRHDQELACDARTLARQPDATAAYADAMLRTQAFGEPLPLACHWGSRHPLKERIMQLKQPLPRRAWQRVGVALVAGAVALTGFAAWSAQPERVVVKQATRTLQSSSSDGVHGSRTLQVTRISEKAADIETSIQLRIDGGELHQLTIVSGDGEAFSARVGGLASVVTLEGTQARTNAPNGQPAYRSAFKIHRGGKLVANPSLLVTPGKPAQIKVGDDASGRFKGIELSMTAGPLSAETRAAIDVAEVAAKEAEVAANQAAREAEVAADAAAKVAAQAQREADVAVRQAEVDARRAARDAEAAARDAARAAAQAARASAEAPPPSPAAPTPPAPPAAPKAPVVPQLIGSYQAAIQAGGRDVSKEQMRQFKLSKDHRWVRIDGLMHKGFRIESEILVVPDGNYDGPMFAGFHR